MLLSDRDIAAEVSAGRVKVEPFSEGMIQPSSVDVRLDRFLNGKTLIRESEMPRSFLERSLQEKHSKPDGQPEYIIL